MCEFLPLLFVYKKAQNYLIFTQNRSIKSIKNKTKQFHKKIIFVTFIIIKKKKIYNILALKLEHFAGCC